MNQQNGKLEILRRFYEPKAMFQKRHYTWWQNTIFLLVFAFIAAFSAVVFMAQPKNYRQSIERSLFYYTKNTDDPRFQKAVASGTFKNGKFTYVGKKRFVKHKDFILGINLTDTEVKKSHPQAGLVFTKSDIVLYAKNGRSKKYDLGEVKFKYADNFQLKSKNLKKEIENSLLVSNKSSYLQSIMANWFFGFIYRILLIWLIFILVIRSVIRHQNRDESLVNLFGFLANASAIPVILMTIVGMFYFNSLILIGLFVIFLLINVLASWYFTKFQDGSVKLKE